MLECHQVKSSRERGTKESKEFLETKPGSVCTEEPVTRGGCSKADVVPACLKL